MKWIVTLISVSLFATPYLAQSIPGTSAIPVAQVTPIFKSDEKGELTKTVGKTFVYKIKKGDSLWKVAETFYKNPFEWPLIYRQDYKPIIDRNFISPGDIVVIPGDQNPQRVKEAIHFACVTGEKLQDKRHESPFKYSGAPFLFQPGNQLFICQTDDGRYLILEKDGHTVVCYDIDYRPIFQIDLHLNPKDDFSPNFLSYGHDPKGLSIIAIDWQGHVRTYGVSNKIVFSPLPTPTLSPKLARAMRGEPSIYDSPNPPPKAPFPVNWVQKGDKFFLSWNPVSNADGYRVYIQKDLRFKRYFKKIIHSTQITVEYPAKDGQVVLAVTAVNKNGESGKLTFNFNETNNGTTPPSTPVNPAAGYPGSQAQDKTVLAVTKLSDGRLAKLMPDGKIVLFYDSQGQLLGGIDITQGPNDPFRAGGMSLSPIPGMLMFSPSPQFVDQTNRSPSPSGKTDLFRSIRVPSTRQLLPLTLFDTPSKN